MFLCVDDHRRVISAAIFDLIKPERTIEIFNFNDLTEAETLQRSKKSKEAHDDMPSHEPMLGVRLMWVHPRYRRQGIMEKVIDLARKHALFGRTFDRSTVAFSQPTAEGFRFALKYGGNDFALCFSFF